MGVLSNKISREELKPGDHIYSWRAAYLFSHHGIYVGDGMVIHFTKEQHGVKKSSIDDFLKGGNLYTFKYGVPMAIFAVKVRGGATLARSDPTDEVIRRATYLLNNGFGVYNLFKKNCEDFAIYCKTGLVVTNYFRTGRSSQWGSWNAAVAAPAIALPHFCYGVFIVSQGTWPISLPLWLLVAGPCGLVFAVGFIFTAWRAINDVGTRRDIVRIPVEKLVMEAHNKEHERAGEVNAD